MICETSLNRTNLSLIDFKLFTFGLLHCHRNSSNGMVMRSSLMCGNNLWQL